MRKRLFALAMAAVMATGLLAGCGQQAETSQQPDTESAAEAAEATAAETVAEEVSDAEPVELYVAAFLGAYGDAFWPEIVEGFETMYADKNYHVNVVSNSKIEDIVLPQLRNGEGPDVVYLGTNSPSGFAQKLIASGSVLNLTDLLEQNVPGEDVKLKDKILPGFLDTTATMPYADGDTFMLPFFYSTNGVFYNKALFGEGGYTLPETWDEFLALGEQAEADGRKLFIYPKAGYLDNFLLASIASASGNDVLQDWLKYEDVYSDPGVVKVFESLSALEPYFAWDVFDPAKPIDNEAKILNNEVLFVPSGSWMPSELVDYEKDENFEYGFMAPPAVEKGGDRYCAGMMEQIYALNTGDAAKQEAAKQFLAYLYSDEAVEIIARNKGGIVPIVGSLEIAKAAGVDDLTLELYGVYDNGAKFTSGSFVAANAEGINWKQTYCFSMDSIMQGLDGCDATWWLERMRTDAALLKEGIQTQ